MAILAWVNPLGADVLGELLRKAGTSTHQHGPSLSPLLPSHSSPLATSIGPSLSPLLPSQSFFLCSCTSYFVQVGTVLEASVSKVSLICGWGERKAVLAVWG